MFLDCGAFFSRPISRITITILLARWTEPTPSPTMSDTDHRILRAHGFRQTRSRGGDPLVIREAVKAAASSATGSGVFGCVPFGRVGLPPGS